MTVPGDASPMNPPEFASARVHVFLGFVLPAGRRTSAHLVPRGTIGFRGSCRGLVWARQSGAMRAWCMQPTTPAGALSSRHKPSGHDVATYADTGQRWQDSGFKRYRLADGSAVTQHGEDSFLIVVSGTILRPSRLTLNRKPAAA